MFGVKAWHHKEIQKEAPLIAIVFAKIFSFYIFLMIPIRFLANV